MIIYCTGSKNEDSAYFKFFRDIVETVESLGHTVLAESSAKFASTIPLTEKQKYKRNLKWIDGSKAVIAEISSSTLENGFEIAYALLQRKIPVLALHMFEAHKASAMLTGCDSPLLSMEKYSTKEDLKKIINTFLSKIN